MKVFYRISDKGNPKEKVQNAGKRDCLLNAIQEFGKENIHVIADNCSQDTIDFLKDNQLNHEITSQGNSASFIYMVRSIIDSCPSDEYVYLLEDDYIHLPDSRMLLEEGLAIGDYVTLYDHPDKYVMENEQGNPLNYRELHHSRLYVTLHSHWRETDSTTMTFACRVKTLKEDLSTWEKYTKGRIPDDYHGFMEITQNSVAVFLSFLSRRKKRECMILLRNILFRKKMKKLISAVPAHATHAEIKWLAPVVDWMK